MLRKRLILGAFACAALSAAQMDAQVRLIGMTGNQSQGVWNGVSQESLFQIDFATADTSLISALDFTYDSQAIGFNPEDGMLYRTGGIDAYRCNDPNHYSFNDTHYMERMVAADLALGTPVETEAIFNANPAQTPKPAPRPTWVYPQDIRVDPTDPCNEPEVENTNDEYHSLRGLAWSSERNLFFGSDEEGIFTMTTDGISQFVGIPRPDFRDVKGIVILNIEGQERLFVGTKEQTGPDPLFGSELIEVDMETGLEVSAISLKDPVLPTLGATGILGMSVHPETGVLYAVSKGGSPNDPLLRELITINPLTGDTALVGELGANISSIAFVYPVDNPTTPGDTDGDGDVDLDDLNNVRNNFGAANPPVGDTDGDNDVDLDDLNAVRNNFGTGGSNAVPEPSTAILALAGLAVLGYRARRK